MMDSRQDKQLLGALADDILGRGVLTETSALRAISSVEIVRLVVHIEKRFQVAVPDAELRAENFESIDAVVAMLNRSRVAGLGAS